MRAALGGAPSSSFRPHADGLLQVLSVPITVGGEPASHRRQPQRGLPAGRRGGLRFQTADRQRDRLRHRRARPGVDAAAGVLAGHRPRALSGRTARVSSGDADYVLLVEALHAAPERAGQARAAGGGGSPFVVVLRSRTEQLRFLGPIQTAIGVDRPADDAAGDRAELCRRAHGDAAARRDHQRHARGGRAPATSTRKIPVQRGSWDDEDARLLASTFNTLTDSIARFEKEAAQRERLSSLGRLSSVVAHEIRNPLMIIKSAARTPAAARMPPPTSARRRSRTSTRRSRASTGS
ncbi:MAG: hypothetical protein MZU84_04290 [Sphingobacterium sp.]|nr:hypothetical protein [Sphingobacterium sp.]